MDILKNIPLQTIAKIIPEVIKAAFSEANKDRAEEFGEIFDEVREDVGTCAHLVLEMLKDPLAELGIDIELPASRDMGSLELRAHVEKQLKKSLTIIPHN
jgi:hypothetical protein